MDCEGVFLTQQRLSVGLVIMAKHTQLFCIFRLQKACEKYNFSLIQPCVRWIAGRGGGAGATASAVAVPDFTADPAPSTSTAAAAVLTSTQRLPGTQQ